MVLLGDGFEGDVDGCVRGVRFYRVQPVYQFIESLVKASGVITHGDSFALKGDCALYSVAVGLALIVQCSGECKYLHGWFLGWLGLAGDGLNCGLLGRVQVGQLSALTVHQIHRPAAAVVGDCVGHQFVALGVAADCVAACLVCVACCFHVVPLWLVADASIVTAPEPLSVTFVTLVTLCYNYLSD